MDTCADHSDNTLQCYVQSIAVLGPGFPDWEMVQSVLCGQQDYQRNEFQIPSVPWLPATERRRVGNLTRLALSVGQAAIETANIDASELTTVFTSSSGDGDNSHAMFTALAHDENSERFISPTRFHNSTHNAPAGYWSIANQCKSPSTSLCAYDASFAAGLLEACCQSMTIGKQVLLVSSDVMYPYPLSGIRPMSSNFAVAMVLNPAVNPAHTKLTLKCTTEPISQMEDHELNALCLSNPSARSLPLLQTIAKKPSRSGQASPGRVRLEYLAPLSLEILVD